MDLRAIYRNRTSLSLHDQHYILYRFQQLFKSGYSLNDVLEILMWDKNYQSVASSIQQSLQNGNTFVESLSNVHFNKEVIQFLTLALQHDNLAKGLEHCCTLLQQRKEFIDKLKKLSRYPLLLFSFFIVILFFMKTSIFPSFAQLIGNNANVQFMFISAELVINFLFYGIIGCILLSGIMLVCGYSIRQILPLERKIDICNHLPIYKHYKRMNTTYLFAIHLSSLLTSGLTINECLQIMKAEDKEDIIPYYAAMISEHLAKGYSYTSILPQCQLLTDQLGHIMSKDRNQSQLESDLNLYAEHLIRSLENYVKKWMGFLQPFLLSVLALFIVFVYLALMLPMFDYMNSL
ncbi:competence type IV pilus assembly protein ComGB [Gracilibacillus alcaliphilus]|uniref:competence type IV pilus assembly protein ComGB n=1 Tax=Gracilibacillus alcaliphilus TaxID=1401441 RepID=UPI001958BBB8|nr:competence type IV pilus assembly protein ComGB [Gracilibacillus alcaliphilus]MBM7675039.1 competence protein ComGB [Gracilibacillus alcaliphilus]